MLTGNYMNTIYGHEAILRNYCGVKLPYVVPGLLEHGWEPNFREGKDLINAPLSEKSELHLVVHERGYWEAKKHGYNVAAIGAPILYLQPQELPEPHDKSLLLFPSHSTPEFPFIDPMDRFRVYLKDIQPLLEHFHPITACLFWFNYQDKQIRKIYEDAGLATTTVGHIDDHSFLYKLRNLMGQHSYVSSNELATALIYALYWHRKVFLYGTPRKLEELDTRRSEKTRTLSIDAIKANTCNVQSMYPELRWKNFDDCIWSF